MDERYCFISYSTRDAEAANIICEAIETAGIRCWIAPRDIDPGRHYGEAILDALEGCEALVLVLSSRSNSSEHVLREVERAASMGSHIIPVRIEDIQPSKGMKYFIGVHHWLDAYVPPLAQHLARLSDGVHKIMAKPSDKARTMYQELAWKGAPVPRAPLPVARATPSKPMPAMADTVSCDSCGASLPEDAAFCHKCGRPVGATVVMPAGALAEAMAADTESMPHGSKVDGEEYGSGKHRSPVARGPGGSGTSGEILVTCPSCGSRFRMGGAGPVKCPICRLAFTIGPTLDPMGRTVRCGSCQKTFYTEKKGDLSCPHCQVVVRT